jgi:hypothetical protein
MAGRGYVQSTGMQATRETRIVSGAASITIAFVERGRTVVADSLGITKSAIEPTGRLADDEATIETVADGVTPHPTVSETIKEASPIALVRSIHIHNPERQIVESDPSALYKLKIHSSE